MGYEPMSRAFIKEDAAGEEIIVPARAPLPAGETNHVTPRGMELLTSELAELTAEQVRLQAAEVEEPSRARRLAVLRSRIEDLEIRISGAVIADPGAAPRDEVGFGATVTALNLGGKFAGDEIRVTIVGVDEAEPEQGLVAFTAPIARALLGRRRGERVSLKLGGGEQTLEVTGFGYDVDET